MIYRHSNGLGFIVSRSYQEDSKTVTRSCELALVELSSAMCLIVSNRKSLIVDTPFSTPLVILL
mgnify:CR=1 FL=1